ncbi:MAG: EF-P lysine aminoacylase EpmA [Pseudomonadota bacterium]
MSWQPTATLATLTTIAAMRRRIRHYFDDQQVLEVSTATLGAHTVTDPAIESIAVTLAGQHGVRYLQTSPEYAMKRLLAAGAPDIYQLGPVFRDGEAGARHQPEFTLIEWYRHGFDLDAIVADSLAMIDAALGRPNRVRRLRYATAFENVLGVPLADCSDRSLAAAAGADAPSGLDSRDAWLDWLLVSQVTPTFAADELTVLTHYPASQAALARLDPADAAWALRFEVFAGTLELANGFVELADADEQAARFAADNVVRRARKQPSVDADPNLLAALANGLPACAGVAVGFERLAMLSTASDDIRQIMPFPPCPEETR